MAVITISRQYGAGGITVGEMVADKLGYSLYDHEIIQMVAKKAKVSTDWVEDLEKEAGSAFQKLITRVVPKGLVDRILDDSRGYIDEEIYVDMLHVILRKIVEEENAVIVGRGGQYILKGFKGVYHVLLVAGKTDRIRFLEEKYDLIPRQALQAVENEDKRRVNFYRKFGKEDYEQPVHYHLIVNTSKMPKERAAELICNLVKK